MTSELSSFDSQLGRLKKAAQVASDTALARVLGITQGSISGAKGRGRIPSDWIKQIAVDFGVSSDWLFFGTGSMERAEEERPIQKVLANYYAETAENWTFGDGPIKRGDAGEATESIRPCPLAVGGDDCDLIMVPKVRARLSAGTGSLETSDEIDGRYAFRSEWLRSKGSANRMVLMDVTGDSMEPDVKDRDMVLIDQSQTAVIAGAIYAVGIDDEVLIKHVDKVPGHYILRSANKDFSPIPIDLNNEALNVRIIGRVVWWCREAR